jgi:hypothetical protein
MSLSPPAATHRRPCSPRIQQLASSGPCSPGRPPPAAHSGLSGWSLAGRWMNCMNEWLNEWIYSDTTTTFSNIHIIPISSCPPRTFSRDLTTCAVLVVFPSVLIDYPVLVFFPFLSHFCYYYCCSFFLYCSYIENHHDVGWTHLTSILTSAKALQFCPYFWLIAHRIPWLEEPIGSRITRSKSNTLGERDLLRKVDTNISGQKFFFLRRLHCSAWLDLAANPNGVSIHF